MNIESYFRGRVDELSTLAERGDPWVFLCASSFIEYLAKLVGGKATSGQEYKDFLKNHFFRICPDYASFQYASGKRDLAEQMYHVLRCGIVHSFSLFADPTAKKRHGGRDRSILLAHRKSGQKHLNKYVNRRRKPPLDAVVFIAEDFIEDIAKVTDSMLAAARKRDAIGRQLNRNIRTWVKAYPPIGELIKSHPPRVEVSHSDDTILVTRITSA